MTTSIDVSFSMELMLARRPSCSHAPLYVPCEGYCVLLAKHAAGILFFMFAPDTEALMEAAVDAMIVIDHQGIMVAANDAAHRMFGFGHHEMVGRNVSVLMPEPDRSAHDGYLARFQATGRAQIIGIGREVIAQRRDGARFPVRLAVGRVAGPRPRFVGIVRDVSEEHAAKAALELERDRANAYLELNDAILLRLDAAAVVREINARGSELLGASAPDLIGRDWLEFFDGAAEREQARGLLTGSLTSGSSRERQCAARDATGERRTIYWRCIAQRDAAGQPAGWLCSGLDVTDEVRRDANARLAQDRLMRVARLATTGEITAGIAHELNQPLAAIAAYARACERFLAAPQADFVALADAVHELGAEALRAGAIIHRLRSLARGGDDTRSALDLNALVEDLRMLLEADARQNETAFSIDLAADLPRVQADGVQLQHVILNLVRNALEAVAELPAGARMVRVSTEVTADGFVELRVTDSGPGIAAEVADSLFEPFCTTKPHGTGLGLPISRTIARSHGGSIGNRACEPRGTCFYFRIPGTEAAA
jgi:two-component system sensor kinase FixL